jgi:ArsR family transcriptional regulator, lead/cadmium/zinc/bismuth-responsive transcriptional repressor
MSNYSCNGGDFMQEIPVVIDVCEEETTYPELMQKAHAYLPDEQEAVQLAETFKALADPTRVRLIAALSHTELCVDDLATLLAMSQSAVSHQLRLLRNLNLVQYRKEGRHVFYRLDDDHVLELFERSREHLQC